MRVTGVCDLHESPTLEEPALASKRFGDHSNTKQSQGVAFNFLTILFHLYDILTFLLDVLNYSYFIIHYKHSWNKKPQAVISNFLFESSKEQDMSIY